MLTRDALPGGTGTGCHWSSRQNVMSLSERSRSRTRDLSRAPSGRADTPNCFRDCTEYCIAGWHPHSLSCKGCDPLCSRRDQRWNVKVNEKQPCRLG